MHIALIWAMAENRVIGKGNRLPWRLPKEMAYFKQITMGKPVISGRKTFESYRKPLAGRDNIVISRSGWTSQFPGVHVLADLDAALARAETLTHINGGDEVIIAGGAEIFSLSLPRADRLYVTLVHAQVEGDVFFPAYDESEFQCVSAVRNEKDHENSHAFTIKVFERRKHGNSDINRTRAAEVD